MWHQDSNHKDKCTRELSFSEFRETLFCAALLRCAFPPHPSILPPLIPHPRRRPLLSLFLSAFPSHLAGLWLCPAALSQAGTAESLKGCLKALSLDWQCCLVCFRGLIRPRSCAGRTVQGSLGHSGASLSSVTQRVTTPLPTSVSLPLVDFSPSGCALSPYLTSIWILSKSFFKSKFLLLRPRLLKYESQENFIFLWFLNVCFSCIMILKIRITAWFRKWGRVRGDLRGSGNTRKRCNNTWKLCHHVTVAADNVLCLPDPQRFAKHFHLHLKNYSLFNLVREKFYRWGMCD